MSDVDHVLALRPPLQRPHADRIRGGGDAQLLGDPGDVQVVLRFTVIQDPPTAQEHQVEPLDLRLDLRSHGLAGRYHAIHIVTRLRVRDVAGEHHDLGFRQSGAQVRDRHRQDRLVAHVQPTV